MGVTPGVKLKEGTVKALPHTHNKLHIIPLIAHTLESLNSFHEGLLTRIYCLPQKTKLTFLMERGILPEAIIPSRLTILYHIFYCSFDLSIITLCTPTSRCHTAITVDRMQDHTIHPLLNNRLPRGLIAHFGCIIGDTFGVTRSTVLFIQALTICHREWLDRWGTIGRNPRGFLPHEIIYCLTDFLFSTTATVPLGRHSVDTLHRILIYGGHARF